MPLQHFLLGKCPHDPGGTMICQLKKYHKKLCVNVTRLFNDQLPTDLKFPSTSSNY